MSRWKRVPWAGIGMLVLGVVLVWSGAVGVLKYQEFIQNVKAEGVLEYRERYCDKFTDEEKQVSWYECDV